MTLKNGRKLEVIAESSRIEMATCSVALDADMQRHNNHLHLRTQEISLFVLQVRYLHENSEPFTP